MPSLKVSIHATVSSLHPLTPVPPLCPPSLPQQPQLALVLAQILASPQATEQVRQQAGLYLKNILDGKEYSFKDTLYSSDMNRLAWDQGVPQDAKSQVKALLLEALRSDVTVARHTSAQVIAELGAMSLPNNTWPELLPSLLSNVTSAEVPDGIKVSTLDALGYTCDALDTEELAQEVTNQILTAIVDGIRKDRPADIRYAAATALRNSLLFCRGNMANQSERDMIMTQICEATQSTDQRVRSASFTCIVEIIESYYEHLSSYMQAIFQLTFATIRQDVDDVACQAVEVWSTLCEVESDRLEDEAPCASYVDAALEHLCPLLLEGLMKQDEDADVDDELWNISMASSTCLGLAAELCRDKIVGAVMPFVLQHIRSQEWRAREAATMAFSSILVGPSTNSIGAYVTQSVPVLVGALSDQHKLVKETTAYTLGRICEHHVTSIPPDQYPALLTGLMGAMGAESPSVAAHSCCAIHNFSMQFERGDTNALSPFVPKLLEVLLITADRSDADENNLMNGAYGAITELIQHAGDDCHPIFLQLLPMVLDRLHKTVQMPLLSQDDKDKKDDLQTGLCALLLVLARRVDINTMQAQGDNAMTALLTVLSNRTAVSAHQEAFLAVGAIADALEKSFERYLSQIHAIIMGGLRNRDQYYVCVSAVGCFGDITRAVEKSIFPYCDDVMTALLENLQDPHLDRSVKPKVLSCFGEIALAIEGNFEKYLDVTLTMLQQAAQTKAPDDDDDAIEYVNELREGILDAYEGIIHGLKESGKQHLLVKWHEPFIGFLENMTADSNKDDDLLKLTIACLGDYTDALGTKVPGLLQKPFVQVLLEQGQKSQDANVQDMYKFTKHVFDKLRQQNGMGSGFM